MSAACFYTKTHEWFKRARTGREPGADSVHTDSRSPWGRAREHGHDGKARGLLCPWPRAHRPLTALCCTKQAQTQHPSLLAAWSHPRCPTDSATLPTPPAQGCPDIAPHQAVQKATLVHVALGSEQLRLPSTAALRSLVRRGKAGGEALDPMNCIPACASGCTSCSFMSVPSTASFPLNYSVVGEDVTNLKEI